jgi:hypothetical protein
MRKVLNVALVVLVMALGGVGYGLYTTWPTHVAKVAGKGVAAMKVPSTVTITGKLALNDTSGFTTANGYCFTSGTGYADLQEGTLVTVSGSNGDILGQDALQAGVYDSAYGCVFNFTVHNVARDKNNVYMVAISHRGTIKAQPTKTPGVYDVESHLLGG